MILNTHDYYLIAKCLLLFASPPICYPSSYDIRMLKGMKKYKNSILAPFMIPYQGRVNDNALEYGRQRLDNELFSSKIQNLEHRTWIWCSDILNLKYCDNLFYPFNFLLFLLSTRNFMFACFFFYLYLLDLNN